MTNPLVQFLAELWNRFSQKSPKLFQILTTFFGSVALLVYLPQALTFFDITLPDAWNNIVVKIVGAVSFGIALVSKLSVSQATTVANNTNILPFTESHPVDLKPTTAAKVAETTTKQ